jgi:hypothetical protein
MPATSEVPTSWVALETRQDWERVRSLGGFIVISDDVNDAAEGGPKYHHRGCRGVKLAHFTRKVVGPLQAGVRPNGRYWWVSQEAAAREGGARACGLTDDPMYTT